MPAQKRTPPPAPSPPAQPPRPDRALADWDRLRTLLALRRGGTLSAAARSLGVDHTTIARRLESLERGLDTPLFTRTPDGFTPTPTGEQLLAAAERMEAEVTSLLRRLDGAPTGLTGTIRLTTTPHLATSLLAPSLAPFLAQNPGLQVELVGDARAFDLSRREADLALRLSRPDTPGIVARRLGSLAFAFYAAAHDPRPFEDQPFLAYGDSVSHAAIHRHLADLIPPERIILRANSMHALQEAARTGLGATLLSCFSGESDPGLRRLPAPRAMTPLPLWLLFHEDLRRSPRLRAAVAFLDSTIAAHRGALLPVGFPFDPLD